MRLIDADRLKIKISGGIIKPHELVEEIDKRPTVEAIPVEWIREYCKYNHTPDGMEWHKAVDLIIKRWEKENE